MKSVLSFIGNFCGSYTKDDVVDSVRKIIYPLRESSVVEIEIKVEDDEHVKSQIIRRRTP